MRRRLAFIAALPLLATAACGGQEPAAKPATPSPSKSEVFQVTGKFYLSLADFTWDEDPPVCAGSGGYDDLALGAQVVVSDPAGTTVAVGSVTESIPITEWDDDAEDYLATACTLRFLVTGVPAGKGFYGIEVSHRGRLQYSEAQARKELELTIGS
jgi:hypothetical protein